MLPIPRRRDPAAGPTTDPWRRGRGGDPLYRNHKLLAIGEDRLDDDSRTKLTGLTDKAIASDLEVSERTVRRRISQLQELLGSQTRFQLGVQASRHGWL